MKRMWSKNELKNIADVQAKAVQKDISTLVDKDGHPRFIEGDITINEVSGVTQTYGKWSLSGTHLLIIIGIDIANGSEVSGGILVTISNLPEWIRDKVVPLYATTIVDNKTFNAYADNFSAQSLSVSLQKSTNLYVYNSAFTATLDRHCRISFDLLIDND